MNIDKLNEFDVLAGFRFVEAHEQTAECSDHEGTRGRWWVCGISHYQSTEGM